MLPHYHRARLCGSRRKIQSVIAERPLSVRVSFCSRADGTSLVCSSSRDAAERKRTSVGLSGEAHSLDPFQEVSRSARLPDLSILSQPSCALHREGGRGRQCTDVSCNVTITHDKIITIHNIFPIITPKDARCSTHLLTELNTFFIASQMGHIFRLCVCVQKITACIAPCSAEEETGCECWNRLNSQPVFLRPHQSCASSPVCCESSQQPDHKSAVVQRP